MPGPETASLKQDALLWAATGVDGYGQYTVSASPVAIRCRWEHNRGTMLDAQGNTVALDATVFVDREITIGSRMWLGTLAEFVGTGEPGEATELMEVKKYTPTPDIKGRAYTRSVGLMRFRDRQ